MADRGAAGDGFTKEERAAMKQRAAELRAQAKRDKAADKAAADLQDVRDAIEALDGSDRQIAEALHRIVSDVAPQLAPRTYYGMPAYAKDGKVLLFLQPASKFKAPYATLGFEAALGLADGAMWPVAFAVESVGDAEERRIAELVRLAAG